MSETLTPQEQAAAKETLATIQALRADSRQRLRKERQDVNAVRRRRANVLRALRSERAKA